MLIWAVLPAAAECAAEPLGVIPTKINIRSKSIIEALLELGQTSSVCFGIEIRDDRLARTPVAWTEPGPVGKLVESALSDAKGYKLQVRGRIVLISPSETDEPTWLDTKIPHFKADRSGLQSLNNLLFMELRLVEDPSIAGFAGHYRPGQTRDEIGPFDVRNRTVRDVLDLLVGSSMGGLWLTAERHVRSRALSTQPFWVTLQYAESLATNTALMQSIVQRIQSGFDSEVH